MRREVEKGASALLFGPRFESGCEKGIVGMLYDHLTPPIFVHVKFGS